jgi:uncharacterized protein YjbI with pentapeptide repeats
MPNGTASNASEVARGECANNPWYTLATMHGDQALIGLTPSSRELIAKNRSSWNRWIAASLTDEERYLLISFGIPDEDLKPLDDAEKDDHLAAFNIRSNGNIMMMPSYSDVIDFSGCIFNDAISFDGYIFRKANFSAAAFHNHSFFSRAIFIGDADFRWAKFTSSASFGKAIFQERADFTEAHFQLARFSHAVFRGFTLFFRTEFVGRASFDESKFYNSVIFNVAKFTYGAAFKNAEFHDRIEFINAEFAAKTEFANACFRRLVPDFRGADMHEATEWHAATWPPPPRDVSDARAQVYAYERLKQEMERLKKHEDEQKFFAKELRARRGLTPILSESWFMNILYEYTSNYGISIVRPVAWLIVTFLGGVLFFARAPIIHGSPLSLDRAASLSFANIFSFLPYNREIITGQLFNALSPSAKAVEVVQSVSGVVLLFLLGLGLRNRFRMK